MPHIIAGSEAIGSDYLQTAGGFIRVSRLSEGPRFFRSALSVDDLGPNDVFVVHYGTASMETVRQTLRSARVTPLAPLPNNAAVVRGATPYALATIARAGFTTLAWTPGFIISPLVGATPMLTPQQAASSNLSMVAQVFPGADMDSAGSLLAGMGGTVTGQFNNSITFQIDINDLRSNAGMVRGSMFSYIGEQMPVISADEDTIAGVEIAEFRNGARPYHDALVDGRGVIVGVTDTGISLDAAVLADTAGGSTDIIGLPAAAAGPTHRKVVAYVRAQDVPGSGGLGDLESCDGVTAATHGHLVASLIAGNAKDVVPDVRVLSGLESNLTGSATKHAVDGVASGSKIYFVDDQLSAGCSNPEQIEAQTPGLLSANTAASKAAGARIHNFSFSVLGSNSAYDANAADIDSWLVANKDFLVVVAAGNQGTDLLSDGNLDFNSITSPGTAKNVVTVGSTANVDNALDPTNSVIPNVVNNGIETISRFQGGRASGQGPAAQTTQSNGAVDWRIKPDVMAPGDEFGNQRLTAPTTCLSSDNDQVGGVECNRQLPGIFEGTSFAAAAASGAAADIASYFDQGFQPNGQAGISAAQTLSGAELKAALIASTDLMTGNPSWEQLGAQVRLGFYNPKHLFPFTPEQGYGRIQLDKLLPLNSEPGTPAFISSETVNLASPGSSVTRTFTVLDPGQAFRVAAAWYDPAAIAGAMSQGKLIQDVDLTVTDCGPDGICGVPGAADDTIYNGNFFSEDKNYDGSLTEIPIDFVCDNDPAKPCDPGAF
ncbi:MAG: S8 family serine peptidase, partial [Acidobacteriota bacterium]